MTLPTACPKPLPRITQKKAAKRDEFKILRALGADIRKRDGFRCRCCDAKDGLESHHIQPRSRGGAHVSENLVSLCKQCHKLVQTHWIWIEGDDANKPLSFSMTEKVAEAVFKHRTRPKQVRIEKLPRD